MSIKWIAVYHSSKFLLCRLPKTQQLMVCARCVHDAGTKKQKHYTLDQEEALTVSKLIKEHRQFKDGLFVEASAGNESLTAALLNHVKKKYAYLDGKHMQNKQSLNFLKEKGVKCPDLSFFQLIRGNHVEEEQKLISTLRCRGDPLTVAGVDLQKDADICKGHMLDLMKRHYLKNGLFSLSPSEYFLILHPDVVKTWMSSSSPSKRSTHTGVQMEFFYDIKVLHKIPVTAFSPSFSVSKKSRKTVIDGHDITGEEVYLLHLVLRNQHKDISFQEYMRFSNFTKNIFRTGAKNMLERYEALIPGSQSVLIDHGFTVKQKEKELSAHSLYDVFKILTSMPEYENSALKHQIEEEGHELHMTSSPGVSAPQSLHTFELPSSQKTAAEEKLPDKSVQSVQPHQPELPVTDHISEHMSELFRENTRMDWQKQGNVNSKSLFVDAESNSRQSVAAENNARRRDFIPSLDSNFHYEHDDSYHLPHLQSNPCMSNKKSSNQSSLNRKYKNIKVLGSFTDKKLDTWERNRESGKNDGVETKTSATTSTTATSSAMASSKTTSSATTGSATTSSTKDYSFQSKESMFDIKQEGTEPILSDAEEVEVKPIVVDNFEIFQQTSRMSSTKIASLDMNDSDEEVSFDTLKINRGIKKEVAATQVEYSDAEVSASTNSVSNTPTESPVNRKTNSTVNSSMIHESLPHQRETMIGQLKKNIQKSISSANAVSNTPTETSVSEKRNLTVTSDMLDESLPHQRETMIGQLKKNIQKSISSANAVSNTPTETSVSEKRNLTVTSDMLDESLPHQQNVNTGQLAKDVEVQPTPDSNLETFQQPTALSSTKIASLDISDSDEEVSFETLRNIRVIRKKVPVTQVEQSDAEVIASMNSVSNTPAKASVNRRTNLTVNSRMVDESLTRKREAMIRQLKNSIQKSISSMNSVSNTPAEASASTHTRHISNMKVNKETVKEPFVNSESVHTVKSSEVYGVIQGVQVSIESVGEFEVYPAVSPPEDIELTDKHVHNPDGDSSEADTIISMEHQELTDKHVHNPDGDSSEADTIISMEHQELTDKHVHNPDGDSTEADNMISKKHQESSQKPVSSLPPKQTLSDKLVKRFKSLIKRKMHSGDHGVPTVETNNLLTDMRMSYIPSSDIVICADGLSTATSENKLKEAFSYKEPQRNTRNSTGSAAVKFHDREVADAAVCEID